MTSTPGEALPTDAATSPSLRTSLRFVGRRTLLLLGGGAACGMVQSVVEPALGLLLQVALLRAGLTNGARVPGVLRDIAASTPALVALFAVIAVLRTGAQFGASQCGVVARASIEARLRNAAAERVLAEAFATLTPATDVTTQLADVFPRGTALWQNAVTLISYGLQATTIAIVLFWLSPPYATAAFVVLACCAVAVRAFGRRADRLSRALGDEHRAVLADFERAARHHALVKVLAMEDEERRTVACDVARYESTLSRGYALVHASGALGPLAAMGLVIVLVVGGPNGWGHGPVGLVTFLFLFVRLGQIAGSLGGAFTGVRGAWRPWCRALEWLGEHRVPDGEPAPSPARAAPGAGGLRPISAPAVEAVDLHVSYPGHENVLESISFRVAPGALAGVRGVSGCGKTTLLRVILGLVAPDRGELRVDGAAPADYIRGGAVGYVGADGGVFAGTIRANLAYGWRGTGAGAGDAAALLEAVARAHASEVVAPSLGGLDRVVGEGGEGLSAGQRQRIALARALLRQPKLLVLDEPTANVNAATETLIADALVALRGSTTCIVVAHREALLAKCDIVLTVEGGRLAITSRAPRDCAPSPQAIPSLPGAS